MWQHAKCVGISKNSVPEQYFCEECKPGWHEDLHNLAFRAINLDVMVGTVTTSNITNVNIIEESGSTPVQTRTTGFKRRISVPAGVPALNEITENIISNDAQPLIDAFLKGINVPRLKRQQHAQDPNLVNFEFQATAVMDSPEHLALLQKSLEVREIRNRGYQKKGSSTKYGLFATEYCDPGHFVCEFIGHVQLKTLLNVKGAKEVPVAVTQSFVLYPFASVDLAVDSRKFGTGARYARRSCRPNVQIKAIVIETGNGEYSLSWGLFARNVIKANSEILLPLDYQCGNGLFRYECACNAPDFCLGPLDNFKDLNVISTVPAVASLVTSSHVQRAASPKPSAFVESAELEALGIRRSSSAVLQDSQAAPTATTRPILDSRKLTREERKLQKYIEYFEKMDHADAAKKVTFSSNSSLSSRKGSSSGSSPQPIGSSSRISSPGKPGSGAGLKKAWKQMFSSGSAEGVSSVHDVENGLTVLEEPLVAVKPVTGAKRGRKPAAAKIQSEPVEDATSTVAPQSSPLKPKTSPNKRKNSKASEVAIIDEDSGEEIDVGFEEERVMLVASEGSSSKKKKAKIDKIEKPKKSTVKSTKIESPVEPIAEAVTSPLIDIERSSSVLNAAVSSTAVPPTQPETPSKKKLSLSDYLKKKKASPVESVPLNFDDDGIEEEGEIVVAKFTGARTEDFGFGSSSVPSSPQHKQRDTSDYNFLTSAVVKGPEEGESMRDYLRQSMSSNNSISMAMDLQSFEDRTSGTSSVSRDRDSRDRELRDSRYMSMDSGYSRSSRDVDSSGYRHSRDLEPRDRDRDRDYRDVRDVRDVREPESRYSRHAHYTNQQQQSHYQPQPQPRPQSIVEPMRTRDDRDKEFDRLQREREFERREAERERERRERDNARFGEGYSSGASSGYRPNSQQGGGGYRPYRPQSHGYHGNNPNDQRPQGHGHHGYQPRPPRPTSGYNRNSTSANNTGGNNKY